MANIITNYRPARLDDIVGQERIKTAIRKWIDYARKDLPIPNLLFVGEPGIGKTTMAFAIAYELFGQNWRDVVLELNASDERGIETMRERVKLYSGRMPFGSNINLVILDECDYLTPEAQAILRRLMEDFPKTKFILCCNWLNRIIEPIRDRCAIYRFEKYKNEEIKMILEKIPGISNIDQAVAKCGGSVRKALNIAFSGIASETEVAETVTVENLKDLLYKYDVEQVINKVFEQIKEIKNEDLKLKLAMKLMGAEYHIKFGCNPYLQLYGVLLAWKKGL